MDFGFFVGFFPCADCIYHKNGYFQEYLSFSFKSKNKLLTWHNRPFFSCDSKILTTDIFYIGQNEELKQRARKHKSDVIHPNNSN